MADQFTQDQLDEWKDYWELFDDTGNGKIFWKDVGAAIRSFGWAPTNKQWIDVLGKMEQGDAYNPEDAPITGEDLAAKEIDFDNFLKVLAEVSTQEGSGTAADFCEGLKVFDKDQSGYVQAVEIQHILGSLGEQLSTDDINTIFKGVETNAAGMMKYTEFVDHIMKDPADN